MEQIHGKKKAKVCLDINRPSEKRVETGDAGGRPSWRSSLPGDPGVKFLLWKTRRMKKKRKEERNGLTLTGLLMEGTRVTSEWPLFWPASSIPPGPHPAFQTCYAHRRCGSAGFFCADTYVPYFRFSHRSAHWIAQPDSSGCYCLGRVPRLAAPTTFARMDGYANRRCDLQRPRAV